MKFDASESANRGKLRFSVFNELGERVINADGWAEDIMAQTIDEQRHYAAQGCTVVFSRPCWPKAFCMIDSGEWQS